MGVLLCLLSFSDTFALTLCATADQQLELVEKRQQYTQNVFKIWPSRISGGWVCSLRSYRIPIQLQSRQTQQPANMCATKIMKKKQKWKLNWKLQWATKTISLPPPRPSSATATVAMWAVEWWRKHQRQPVLAVHKQQTHGERRAHSLVAEQHSVASGCVILAPVVGYRQPADTFDEFSFSYSVLACGSFVVCYNVSALRTFRLHTIVQRIWYMRVRYPYTVGGI